MRHALAVASSLAMVAALSFQPTAWAASECAWVPADAELAVTVTHGLHDDRLIVEGSAILLNGEQCDAGATTSTVDTISVSGENADGGTFIVDLGGDPFAPGAETESSGQPEIEFVLGEPGLGVEFLGGSGDDVFSVGFDGVNLNEDDDVDVTTFGAFVTLSGGAGNDTFVGTGDDVVGAAPPDGLRASGGRGNDVFVGGRYADNFLWGNGGSDLFVGGQGHNYVVGGPGADLIVGGARSDQLAGNGGNDTLNGLAGGDQLEGGLGDDVIRGADGRDDLTGGPGDDLADGGRGRDLLSYHFSTGPIDVDLRTGAASGPSIGHDTLRSIEAIGGTGRGGRLAGSARAEDFFGDSGPDLILGRRGRDHLYGEGGDDVLKGGPGRDRLFGDVGVDALYGGPGFDWCVQSGGAGTESSCERSGAGG